MNEWNEARRKPASRQTLISSFRLIALCDIYIYFLIKIRARKVKQTWWRESLCQWLSPDPDLKGGVLLEKKWSLLQTSWELKKKENTVHGVSGGTPVWGEKEDHNVHMNRQKQIHVSTLWRGSDEARALTTTCEIPNFYSELLLNLQKIFLRPNLFFFLWRSRPTALPHVLKPQTGPCKHGRTHSDRGAAIVVWARSGGQRRWT